MKFTTLKKDLINYMNGNHHHSFWDAKHLHFTSNKDKQGLIHYVIYYSVPDKYFRIKICKNNITFHNIQNVPGALPKYHSRILGPCLHFARFNMQGHNNYKAWQTRNTEDKYANYDIQQWNKNFKSDKEPSNLLKDVNAFKDIDFIKKSSNLQHDIHAILYDPESSIGRFLTADETISLVTGYQKVQEELVGFLSNHDYQVINKLLALFIAHTTELYLKNK